MATVPEADWVGALCQAGIRPHIAESLAELYRADEQGLLAPRGDPSVRATTGLEQTITAMLTP